MKGKTRAFNNQWILQAEGNLFRAFQNLLRISHRVNLKGDYPEINNVINEICTKLVLTRADLVKLQTLFNDPRATKIEV